MSHIPTSEATMDSGFSLVSRRQIYSYTDIYIYIYIYISSVQFSHSVVSDSLRPHESQHTRPPCPSPTPGVHSDSRPLSRWCHPAISSSVVPFSSCPQSLPASGYFPMSQLFTWGGQSTGISTQKTIWKKLYIIFSRLFSELLQDIEYRSLCYTLSPCCLSILYVVVCIC